MTNNTRTTVFETSCQAFEEDRITITSGVKGRFLIDIQDTETESQMSVLLSRKQMIQMASAIMGSLAWKDEEEEAEELEVTPASRKLEIVRGQRASAMVFWDNEEGNGMSAEMRKEAIVLANEKMKATMWRD